MGQVLSNEAIAEQAEHLQRKSSALALVRQKTARLRLIDCL